MNFKNILVFKIGHLGDTLVAIPSFWAIRNNYPDSKLTLLANVEKKTNLLTALDVLPEEGLFDAYLTYPNTILSRNSIKQYINLILKLRRKKFDCVIYLMTRNRTVKQIKRDKFFFKMCGIKKIIGTSYLQQNLLDYKAPRPLPTVEPESQFLINCLKENEAFNFNETRIIANLNLTDEEKKFANSWIEANCGVSNGQKIVAVGPGSKWESKKWGIENFSDVIKELIRRNDIMPIVFGGQEDEQVGATLISAWGRGTNAAGLLTVRQSAAVLEHCTFYLGNDTGTMHLAAGVDVKCIAIFSAIDYPERWVPGGVGHKIFRHQVACEGCHTAHCYNNSLCLTLTKAEAVYEVCANLLQES